MKKMRKLIAGALVAGLLAAPALASNGQVSKVLDYANIKISVDGAEITPTDANGKSTEPFSIEGSVYVPVRAISEALGGDVTWNSETNTVEITSGFAVPTGTTSLTVRTNGNLGITHAAYNDLFGGDAEKGVSELVASGAVTVNGTAVNASDVTINGGKALWQNEDGTWSWKTHIMRHGENLSYEKASADFVWGLSRLRGPSYTLTLKDGKVTGIDFAIYDAAFAETVTVGEEYTTVTLCDDEGDGSMNRTSPDEIKFPNELLEADSEGVMPSDQCLIIYWEDAEGWHLRRADSKIVTMKGGIKDYTDSLINLEYSEAWHRPTQPIYAMGWLGVEEDQMIQWYLCDGIVSSVSHPDAQEDLATAIETAKKALQSVTVSKDGSGVAAGKMWVTQEYYDTFAQAIADAETALAAKGKLNSFYEEAYFRLALSYGGDGSHYSIDGNAFADGIGFMTFAKQHLSTK